MRRQLAIFSCLWFVIFCLVFWAVWFPCWWWSVFFQGMGGTLPLPGRILVNYTPEPWTVWLVVVTVAGLNWILLRTAYRMRNQREARIFHGWALGIQAVALILLVCLIVIALSLPFLQPAPIIR